MSRTQRLEKWILNHISQEEKSINSSSWDSKSCLNSCSHSLLFGSAFWFVCLHRMQKIYLDILESCSQITLMLLGPQKKFPTCPRIWGKYPKRALREQSRTILLTDALPRQQKSQFQNLLDTEIASSLSPLSLGNPNLINISYSDF